MRVEQIKAIAPLSDVYELNQEARYIVVLRADQLVEETMDAISEVMTRHGMDGGILAVEDPSAIQFFDVAKTGG